MKFIINNNVIEKYEGNESYVIVPEGIQSIADYAFSHAKEMKHISLPSTLEEIGDGAFYSCEGLEEIKIPDRVYYLGTAVFSRCSQLKKVFFSNTLLYLPKITFYQCSNLTDIVFPSGIKKIGRACFQQCTSLKHIDLPDSITCIEENVFDDCHNLVSIHLPSCLEELQDNVFFHCENLKKIELPIHLEKVGVGAFETHGKVSIISHNQLCIRSNMLDHNWNMNWNFGTNGRYNGKNEENYQLVYSYLPNVKLKEWKLEARCILCINYLETYLEKIDFYDDWISQNTDLLIEKMVLEKRFDALNKGINLQLISIEQMHPFLDLIQDREEKAKLLEMSRMNKKGIDDLWDLL